MSVLRTALTDYLGVRRALGYKLERDGKFLEQFIDHLECSGAATVTADSAVAWATMPRDVSAG